MIERIRVLIAEDSPAYAAGLHRLLEAEVDLEVVGIARTAAEATQLALLTKPLVVLMDYSLGDGTAAEATAAIVRELPATAVVLLTGSAGDDELAAAVAAGIRGFVLKTEPETAIIDAVRRAAVGETLFSADVLNRLLAERRPRRATVEAALRAGAGHDEAEAELARAIPGGELFLLYQPRVSLRSGQVLGAEALVRWQHPDRGVVSPTEFIPLAEASGLTAALTPWVLEAALDQVARWRAAGSALRINVNISSQDLDAPDFSTLVERALARHKVPAEALVLELTETEVIRQAEDAREQLARLRALGVGIALDDFGTGYSSLSYLHRLPLSGLKIDRSFIARLMTDDASAAIVRATIELGHSIGLAVTAEGVEDAATLERLASLGCDAVQGFYISPPRPAAGFAGWLVTGGWRPTAHAVAVRSQGTPLESTLRGRVVLVVDDDEAVRQLVARILTEHDVRALTAGNAAEALEQVSTAGGIDLVLVDLVMPGMNGRQLADRIHELVPGLQTVFTSGFAHGVVDLVIGGARSRFLAKPFTEVGLIRTIAEALAGPTALPELTD